MNITLINPRLRSWSPTIVPPLGLAYVAASLEKHGYKVRIVDMNANKVSDKELIQIGESSDVVGVTGMITEYNEVKRITSLVKRYGRNDEQNKVIVGGALATTFPHELVSFPQVDCVVTGEGEDAVMDLMYLYAHGKEPEYPIFNKCQSGYLDRFPFPSRHLLGMNCYNTQFHDMKGSIKATTMISSRGCPYSCTFCYKDMWGYKWRGRSPQNIVDEMDTVYHDYGISGFIFNDDTFVMDRNRVFELCWLLSKRNYKWMCNGRINLMSPELLEVMALCGCVEIAYGIESGNQDMLDLIKKNITLEQIKNVIKCTKASGLRVNGYFILGLPGETKESIKRTIDFAEELQLDFYGFSLATPMPNTGLYRYAMENGYLGKDYALSLSDWSFKANVNMTVDCTDKELQDFKNEVFTKFTIKKFGLRYFIGRFFKVLKGIQSFGELKSLFIRSLNIIRKVI